MMGHDERWCVKMIDCGLSISRSSRAMDMDKDMNMYTNMHRVHERVHVKRGLLIERLSSRSWGIPPSLRASEISTTPGP